MRSPSRRRSHHVLLELGRAEHAAGAPTATDRLEEAWRATGDAEIALELTSMLGERTRWPEAAAIARAALARAARDRAGTDLGETELHLFALLADVVRMDPSIGGDEPERLAKLSATLEGDTPGERHVLAAAAVITPVDTAEEHARTAELTQRTQADVNRFSDTGDRVELHPRRPARAGRGRRLRRRWSPRVAAGSSNATRRSWGCAGGSRSSAARCPRRATTSRARWPSSATSRSRRR